MIIDYKFNSIIRDGINTTINITVWRGDFVSQSMIDLATMQTVTVSKYVRSAKLLTRQLSRAGTFTTAQIRTYVNNRLKEIRDANYPTLTFLSEQEIYV